VSPVSRSTAPTPTFPFAASAIFARSVCNLESIFSGAGLGAAVTVGRGVVDGADAFIGISAMSLREQADKLKSVMIRNRFFISG
jgi:hypothetical protein